MPTSGLAAFERAEHYLQQHNDYVDALQALLADLAQVSAQGAWREEAILCDAMRELRSLADAASGENAPQRP